MATSGYKAPASNAVRVGTAWANPTYADGTDNGSEATCLTTSSTTRTHDWYGFDFSAIPDGSTVTQLDLSANCYRTGTSQHTCTLEWVIGGTPSTAATVTSTTSTNVATATLTTGLPTLTQLKSGALASFAIGGKKVTTTTSSRNFAIDTLTVQVTYTAPSGGEGIVSARSRMW